MFSNRKVKTFFAAAFMSLFLFQLLPNSAYAADYTVVQGDTLYNLGKLFNTTAGTIMKGNNLAGAVIYPGQVLNISSDTYTVKKGDSLYLIAKRYGISVNSLRKANNEWDDSIFEGQKLILPGVVSGKIQAADTARAGISYSEADVDLLARLITAEADGEPYNAKVAVGAVVLNRVADSQFPNTISAVIYEKSNGYYQFTPVENGWIQKPASQDARKAAYDALNGVDPSKGALFYFDDSATNKWLWSKPLAARIGHMVFVY